jgi:hypothetical protein
MKNSNLKYSSYFALSVISAIINFVSYYFQSNYFGIDLFGKIYLTLGFLSIIDILFSPLVDYILKKCIVDNKKLNGTLFLIYLIKCFLYISIFGVLYFLNIEIENIVFYYVITISFSEVMGKVLMLNQKNDEIIKTSFLVSLSSLLVVLLVINYSHNYILYFLLAGLINILFYLRFFKLITISTLNIKEIKIDYYNYTFPLHLQSLVSVVKILLPRLFLLNFSNFNNIGSFELMIKIYDGFYKIIKRFSTSYLNRFYDLLISKNTIQERFKLFFNLMIMFSGLSIIYFITSSIVIFDLDYKHKTLILLLSSFELISGLFGLFGNSMIKFSKNTYSLFKLSVIRLISYSLIILSFSEYDSIKVIFVARLISTLIISFGLVYSSNYFSKSFNETIKSNL